MYQPAELIAKKVHEEPNEPEVLKCLDTKIRARHFVARFIPRTHSSWCWITEIAQASYTVGGSVKSARPSSMSPPIFASSVTHRDVKYDNRQDFSFENHRRGGQ